MFSTRKNPILKSTSVSLVIVERHHAGLCDVEKVRCGGSVMDGGFGERARIQR